MEGDNMAEKNAMTARTIELTPKWQDVMPILVEAAANGATVEGRKAAWSELMRLAKIADDLHAEKRMAT